MMPAAKKTTPESVPVTFVKVLGKKFKLRVQDEEESSKNAGTMSLSTQTISYDPRPALEYVQDTILHECIHAIDETLNLKMTERQVHQMANGLIALLHDNPELAKWMINH